MCTTYDYILKLIEDEENSKKIKEIIRNQTNAFIKKLHIPIYKTFWIKNLKIMPVSIFSINVINKMFDEFYNAILDVNIFKKKLFQKEISNIDNLTKIEKYTLQSFQTKFKNTSINKMAPFFDIKKKNSFKIILFLTKLYFDPKIFEIFEKIFEISISNRMLKYIIIQSKFVKLINQFFQKVLINQLNFEEFFLVKYFNLKVILTKFVILKNENLQNKYNPIFDSKENLKNNIDFDKIFFNLEEKYKEVNTSLDNLTQIKNNKYSKMLFNKKELKKQESFLKCNWANESLIQKNIFYRSTNQGNKLNIKHLRTFDCWFKRKIYYLICFKNNCMQVLTNSNDLSKQEMKKLFTYTSGKKNKIKFKKFLKKNWNTSGHTMSLSQFNEIFLLVNELFKYLKTKYFSSNPIIISPIENNLKHLKLTESILLFEYLLYDADKKYEEVFTNQSQPIIKENILVFKNMINKLLHFKQISKKLVILPHILMLNYDHVFNQIINYFENKIDIEDVLFDEALCYYYSLHPSLQEINEEKLEFIEKVCTSQKYKGKTN